VTLRLV